MPGESKYKGFAKALEALKSLPPQQQKNLIQELLKKDPELVKQLLENLFSFSDIPKLSKSDFKILWFEIPRHLWLTALRGASDEILMFIRSCQTERAFTELLEDLKILGPQPKSAVEQAQQALVNEINSLAKQGRVVLQKRF